MFFLFVEPSVHREADPGRKKREAHVFLMFSGGSLAEILKRFPLVGNRPRKGNKKQTHVIQVCILHDDFGI